MIIAVLQARMSSSRLPGKVMLPLIGRPMVGRQIDRLRRSRTIDRLVLATSTESSDDQLAAFCGAEGVACHRGPLDDVLGRFLGALAAFGPAEHVVRLTADCPLIDPAVVDAVIDHHLSSNADYTSNTASGHRTFPDGLDVEVMTAAALQKAGSDAASREEREHVTPYIYRNPTMFKLENFEQDRNLGELRWTVDNPQDFRFAEAVFAELLPLKPAFDQDDVLELIGRRPDIAAINAAI